VCRLNLWRMELFKYMKVCQAAMAHVARCRHHTVATRHLQAHLGTSLTEYLRRRVDVLMLSLLSLNLITIKLSGIERGSSR
jgi:hypothetical protein